LGDVPHGDDGRSDLASDLVQAISKLGTAVWDNVKENPKSAIAGFLNPVFLVIWAWELLAACSRTRTTF
jgi:hypothetical protein